jgi:hypothetical protein
VERCNGYTVHQRKHNFLRPLPESLEHTYCGYQEYRRNRRRRYVLPIKLRIGEKKSRTTTWVEMGSMANTCHNYHTKDDTWHPGQTTLIVPHHCRVIVLDRSCQNRNTIATRSARGEADRLVISHEMTALHAKHHKETNNRIQCHLKGKDMQLPI